jgi:hypothetical protein
MREVRSKAVAEGAVPVLFSPAAAVPVVSEVVGEPLDLGVAVPFLASNPDASFGRSPLLVKFGHSFWLGGYRGRRTVRFF